MELADARFCLCSNPVLGHTQASPGSPAYFILHVRDKCDELSGRVVVVHLEHEVVYRLRFAHHDGRPVTL